MIVRLMHWIGVLAHLHADDPDTVLERATAADDRAAEVELSAMREASRMEESTAALRLVHSRRHAGIEL